MYYEAQSHKCIVLNINLLAQGHWHSLFVYLLVWHAQFVLVSFFVFSAIGMTFLFHRKGDIRDIIYLMSFIYRLYQRHLPQGGSQTCSNALACFFMDKSRKCSVKLLVLSHISIDNSVGLYCQKLQLNCQVKSRRISGFLTLIYGWITC